tara:strand:+ start:1273 stop:1470 length:198 start_codon:yes stop_codon:yes gene_type:complete
MSKFGLYTKTNNESHQHINLIEMPSIGHAEAYFAGVKQLSLQQLRDLFIVKEIDNSNKTLMYGNK